MTVEAKTFALPAETARALEALADRHRRPVEDLLADAVDRFLEEEHALVARIEEGLANAEAGETVAWEEAEKSFREMISRAEAFRKAV